jgi:hypothetical protein
VAAEDGGDCGDGGIGAGERGVDEADADPDAEAEMPGGVGDAASGDRAEGDAGDAVGVIVDRRSDPDVPDGFFVTDPSGATASDRPRRGVGVTPEVLPEGAGMAPLFGTSLAEPSWADASSTSPIDGSGEGARRDGCGGIGNRSSARRRRLRPPACDEVLTSVEP